jgi:16S rRNA (adenine1518-N6/adenine1519-N6)-dimethyltransferase
MNELPWANKSLGQHWLTDAEALKAMVEAADVGAGDTVLEIGPGLGTLTKFLTEQAKQVVAVEFDKDLADALPGQVPAANLKVVSEDIMKFDLTTMPTNYKIVANIPYYLTSNLVRSISESSNPPMVAVILVQKEVAERVAAEPGQMSMLSVSAQYYWEVILGREVPARLFTPVPKVSSQILILRRRPKPLFDDIDEKQFFRVVKAGFAARRKTLLNSIGAGLRLEKDQALALLADADIEPNRRAQTLSLDEWYKLYLAARHAEFL